MIKIEIVMWAVFWWNLMQIIAGHGDTALIRHLDWFKQGMLCEKLFWRTLTFTHCVRRHFNGAIILYTEYSNLIHRALASCQRTKRS